MTAVQACAQEDVIMAAIIADRMTAEIDGDFVVFLIGMRINKPLKVKQWFPVFVAMPKMLRWLDQHPEAGLLHWQFALLGPTRPAIVQYWRSFEQLAAYAAGKTNAHLPAWKAFNQRTGSNGDVGIWHETYLVKAGQYETIYNNMPPYGLGLAGKIVPAVGRKAAAKGRLGLAENAMPSSN